MNTHEELSTNAITIDCEKRTRGNWNAPAVVDKYNQSSVQSDWFITGVRVNGVELTEWCNTIDIPTEAFRISWKQPFKTKKAALLSVIADFVQVLDTAAPQWEWQDETDEPEYFRVIASLKETN